MYLVKIGSGTLKEINHVMKSLDLDLWAGVTVDSREQADSIVAQAEMLEPFIEICVYEIPIMKNLKFKEYDRGNVRAY